MNLTNTNTIPQFFATLTTPIANVTGDNTDYTAVFDTVTGSGYNTSTGIFTAPKAGDYLFLVSMYVSGITASHTSCNLKIVATGGTFQLLTFNLSTARTPANAAMFPPAILPIRMVVADTARVTFQVANGTKVITFDTLSTLSAVRLY